MVKFKPRGKEVFTQPFPTVAVEVGEEYAITIERGDEPWISMVVKVSEIDSTGLVTLEPRITETLGGRY